MKTTECKHSNLKDWCEQCLLDAGWVKASDCKLTECNCKEKYGSIKIEHGQEITPHVDCEPMTTDWEKDFDKRNIWKIITSNEEHLAVEKISELIAKAKAEGIHDGVGGTLRILSEIVGVPFSPITVKSIFDKLKDDLENNQ